MKTHILILIACTLFFANSNIEAQCYAIAGPDTTVCGITVDLHGSYSHNMGSEIIWTCLTPGVIFSNPTAENTTAIIPYYYSSTFTTQFILTETIPPSICTSSDTVSITFLRPPHAEVGPTQAVCGYTANLFADTLGSGIVFAQWSSSVTGITINQSGNVPANINADASAVGNFYTNSQAPVYFYWIAQNSQGCISTDSVLVTFYEIPDAYAGEDDSVCGKTYDLAGQFSIDNPNGNWSVYTKPFVTSTADIQPTNSPDGEVTVSDYGFYQFIWTERNASNNTCLDKDTIQIYYISVPQPDAGPDQTVCGSYVELNAVATPGTVGYWQSVLNAWYDPTNWPNDTVFCSSCSNDPNVVAYYSSENDTVAYYWMEFNGQCYGYDTVMVFFGSPIINAGPDTAVVGNQTELSINSYYGPSNMNYYWEVISQPPNAYIVFSDSSDINSIISVNTLGQYTLKLNAYDPLDNLCSSFDSKNIIFSRNSICGNVFYDYNQNGIKDFLDYNLSNKAITLLPDSISTYSDQNGNYSFPCDTGNYTIMIENDYYLHSTTDSVYNLNFSTTNNNEVRNFGRITNYAHIFDARVYLYNSSSVLPSQYHTLTTVVFNYGGYLGHAVCQIELDSLSTFISANPNYTYSINNNIITWNIDSLLPFQFLELDIILYSPPIQNLGDTLHYFTSIQIDSTDINLLNNSHSSYCRIVASYDPNDKQVVPAGVSEHGYILHGQELEYTIHFQNTGNYPALNINLRDTISNALNLSTLDVISSSHPVTWQFNNDREIVFTYTNIMLPYETQDTSGSQGYVTYKISPNPGLADYTEVENTAYIYFDYNPPIVTNTTLNTYVSVIPMSAENTEYSPAINIYPNPASTMLGWNNDLQTDKVSLYNLQGKEIMSIENPESNSVSVENLSEGVYMISIHSGNIVKHARFVKLGGKK